MDYIVSKEKGGKYYVHPSDNPKTPIPGSYGDKRKAIKIAAHLMGITPKAYIKNRKGVTNGSGKEL